MTGFLPLLLGCNTAPGEAEVCLAVTDHDGAGQVRLSSDSGSMVVALETGAGNLKVFDHGAPWVADHWTGKQKRYRLWDAGEVRHLNRLKHVRFSVGDQIIGLSGWRQQEKPMHEIQSAWGGLVDAWGGLDFFASVGDTISFSDGKLCGKTRGCPVNSGVKPEVRLTLDGQPKTFMVDSAFTISRVWGHGAEPQLLYHEKSNTSFYAWPFDEGGRDRYGTGKIGSQKFDGVVGWSVLATSAWTWDLCSGDFQFESGPREFRPPFTVDSIALKRNGHLAPGMQGL